VQAPDLYPAKLRKQRTNTVGDGKMQQLKQMVKTTMDHSSAFLPVWLLCLKNVLYALKRNWRKNIDNVSTTLIQGLTGGMIMLLRYRLWQKMYFKTNGSSSISSSKECVEHVSTSEYAGMILNLPTIVTLHRPMRCPIGDHFINLRSDKDASKFSFQSLIRQSIPFDNGITEDRGDIGQWNVNATVVKNGRKSSSLRIQSFQRMEKTRLLKKRCPLLTHVLPLRFQSMNETACATKPKPTVFRCRTNQYSSSIS
jgi:hypothetical protein